MKYAKNRRWPVWLLVLVLIFCLTACTPSGKGGSDDAALQTSQENTSSDAELPEIEIPDAPPEGASTQGEEYAPDASQSEAETAPAETAAPESTAEPEGMAELENGIIIHENGDIELPELP